MFVTLDSLNFWPLNSQSVDVFNSCSRNQNKGLSQILFKMSDLRCTQQCCDFLRRTTFFAGSSGSDSSRKLAAHR